MNSKQLQYAVVLARVRNFSLAAEELGITQPAFSKQIIALENDLGIKLFDRGANPLLLTAAGEFFVEKAKKLLFEQETLLKIMEGYKSGECGKLTIGIAPFRSLYVMPNLVKELKEKFPKLRIVLQEHGLEQLEKELREGLYDFAIMNLPVDDPAFEVVPLEADALVLAVPETMVHLIRAKKPSGKVRLSDCEDLPFVVVGQNQEMRKLFDKLCADAGIEPNIFVEVTGVTTAREMVRAGHAATVIPKPFLQGETGNSSVVFFELENVEYVRQPAVVMMRNQYVSKYAEYAIELLRHSI